jgi:HEAT repeat protein
MAATGHWLMTRDASPSSTRTATAAEQPVQADGRRSEPHRGSSVVERWKVGEQRLYGVGSSMHIGSEPAEPSTTVDLTAEGTLALTVVTEDAESVVIRGALVDFAGTYSTAAGNEPAPEEALRKPFLVTLTRRGSVQSVALHSDLVGPWHALVRTIIATTQFAEADQSREDVGRWSVEETDQLGRYRAHYIQASAGVFDKTKGVYSHLELAPELLRNGTGPKLSSKTRLSVDRTGLVQRAEATESTSMPLGGMLLTSSTRVTLTLKNVSVGERGSHEAWMSAQTPLYANRGIPLSSGAALQQKRQLVNGATFATLAHDLRRLEPGSDERWAAMDRLSALFDVDPASVQEARRLLAGRLAPEDARGIMGALASADSSKAQAVLTDVAKNGVLEPTTRNTALVHLALTTPTEGTLTELTTLAADPSQAAVRDSALLALGGAAGKALQQPETAEVATRAVESLMGGVEQATDDKLRQLYVTALGNTGAPESLELLKQQMADPNPEIRSAALQAMRAIASEEVDTIFAQSMLQDPALPVRQSAVVAAGYRGLSAPVAQAATQLLRSEPIETVRFDVLRTLGEKLLAAGQRALIELLADSDKSSAVRDKANLLLGRTVEQ